MKRKKIEKIKWKADTLGYKRDLYNKDFDIKVSMEVEVLPRIVPFDIGEEITWNGIENEVNYEAKQIGWSLKGYFEGMVKRILNGRRKNEKESETY